MLNEGRLVEFDEPYELLQKNTSKFFELVQEVGGMGTEKLLNIARRSHQKRLKRNDSGLDLQDVNFPTSKKSTKNKMIVDNHTTSEQNGRLHYFRKSKMSGSK